MESHRLKFINQKQLALFNILEQMRENNSHGVKNSNNSIETKNIVEAKELQKLVSIYQDNEDI